LRKANRLLRTFIKRLIGPHLSNARFAFAAPLAYPPGHFYSPICDPAELRRHYHDPAAAPLPQALAGIDLAHDAQVDLWEQWGAFLPEARALVTGTQQKRYETDSLSYGNGDAIVYCCMLQHLRPAQLIEIGAGSSSVVALDTFDRFFDQRPQCRFIDPDPAFLRSLLTPQDSATVEIVESAIQDVSPASFEVLQSNDVLFIDSTHVIKTGSDVNYELFEILPRLNSGVVVHFHDVFYPFEYPRQWAVDLNYSWNEIYALRAFLTGNRDWEILYFNDYFARIERALVERDAPEIIPNPGGGLWLRRR
jgi:hypothetical protein